MGPNRVTDDLIVNRIGVEGNSYTYASSKDQQLILISLVDIISYV